MHAQGAGSGERRRPRRRRGSGKTARSDRLRQSFLILLVILVSIVFGAMLRPFWMTLILAAIFSALVLPLHRQVLHWYRGRRRLAAASTMLLFVVLVVGPLLTLLGLVAAEAYQISEAVRPWIQEQISQPDRLSARLQSLPWFDRLLPYREPILQKAGELVGHAGRFMFDALSATTRGTVAAVFQFAILVYAMFFFLLDGSAILRKILYYMPLPHADEARMLERFVSVSKATLKSTLLIGVIQGTLGGLGFAIAGLGGALFWGTVMTVLSIVPGVGAALVWLPAVVYLFGSGQVLPAIILGVYCLLVVGMVDNLLRPRLVGRDARMHDLLILLSTLGGLALFGFAGFIVGPILAALFVTLWDIYGALFRDVLPDVGDLRASRPGQSS